MVPTPHKMQPKYEKEITYTPKLFPHLMVHNSLGTNHRLYHLLGRFIAPQPVKRAGGHTKPLRACKGQNMRQKCSLRTQVLHISGAEYHPQKCVL